MAVVVYPVNPSIFPKQSCKNCYGGVKATSDNQVEWEKTNWEGKKISGIKKFFIVEAFSITFIRPVGGQPQFNLPC